jgi:hypothetical protein
MSLEMSLEMGFESATPSTRSVACGAVCLPDVNGRRRPWPSRPAAFKVRAVIGRDLVHRKPGRISPGDVIELT